MKIYFHLEWLKGKELSFKDPAAKSLYLEYTKRIGKFTACESIGSILRGVKKSSSKVWVCDRSAKSKILSSEEIAAELSKVLISGVSELHVVVGAADGISEAQMKEIKPDLRWSFGKLTLPHELAAIVASEQVYRAWAQLRNLPYHKGH